LKFIHSRDQTKIGAAKTTHYTRRENPEEILSLRLPQCSYVCKESILTLDTLTNAHIARSRYPSIIILISIFQKVIFTR
jgi:hypothetical protein